MLCRFFWVAAAGLLTVESATGHHGFAALYDVSDQVRIEGRIHQVHYRNPHSVISVRVVDDNGQEAIWSCETQASSILRRKGVTQDRFPIGDQIVITGARSRRHATRCEIGTAYLSDGSSVTLRSSDGRAVIDVNADDAVTSSPRESVFGHWVRDSFSGAPVRPGFLETLTAAGRRANSQYDGNRDDPTLQCRPVNPVRAMFAPGTPSEIRRAPDRILIRHEFMDTTRVVHLDLTAPTGPPEEMGWSSGRFDGNTLVVETRHFTPGVLLTHVGNSGVLHSDQMTLVERFRVDNESGQLVYGWEASDPEFFNEPIGGQLALSPTTLTIGQFDCVPQAPEP